MPSLEESRHRHSRKASSKSSDSPSVLSTIFNGSRGKTLPSNDQASRLRLQSRKRYSKEQPSKGSELPKEAKPSTPKGLFGKESVDVFAYLEKEDEAYDSGTELAEDRRGSKSHWSQQSSPSVVETKPPNSPGFSNLEVRQDIHEVDKTWSEELQHANSYHSDSGISMGSSEDSPQMQYKYPAIEIAPILETTPETPQTCHRPKRSTDISIPESSRSGPQPWQYEDVSPTLEPELIDTSHMFPLHQSPKPRRQSFATALQPVEGLQHRPTKGKNHKSGLEVLATAIDSHDDSFLKPIYRKFETLNNRMLLYLQDEIAEMEEGLWELDDAIARENVAMGRKPLSRRIEAKLPSQLRWHRMDLLNRSFAKVDQYNRALASYSNLTKSLEPASHADVNVYKDWIAKHSPIVEQDAAFLQHQADLLNLGRPKPSRPQSTTNSNHFNSSLVAITFTLASTITIFKVVPQLFARLVVSAVAGVAVLCTLDPAVASDLKSLRDWARGIAIYSCVMFLVALVID